MAAWGTSADRSGIHREDKRADPRYPGSVKEGETRITFAAVGDVHGQMHAMVRLLQGVERRLGRALDFVLQVGDFEPHRHEADLATMAAPQKYRTLGDFASFHAGRAVFPWPVYFIGGNHEPYGFLDTLPEGGEVADRCFYLGRVGVQTLSGIRVVGLSGIHRPQTYHAGRPPLEAMGSASLKDFIGFTEAEVERAMGLGPADILLVHEWPEGLIEAPSLADSAAVGYRPVGNAPARLLVELLSPKLVLAGHMHERHRGAIGSSPVVCLASVHQAMSSIAIFERTPEGTVVEID